MSEFISNLFKNVNDINYMTTSVNGITLIILTFLVIGVVWLHLYEKGLSGIGTEWLISLAIILLWFASIHSVGTTLQ